MTNVINEAKLLIDKGWRVVPCLKNEKNNFDRDILTRDYTINDFSSDSNIAVNLKKTNILDWDCDSHDACKVSDRLLSNFVSCSMRNKPIDNSTPGDITHHFFTKDQDYSNVDLERLDLNGKKMIELRHDGITIVAPSITPHKIYTDKKYKREWVKFVSRPPIQKNIYKVWNWANFACLLLPVIKSANTGMLKLDACLKRYCDLTDEQRFSFLQLVYSIKFPNEWGRNKDMKPAKVRRIIKSNNNDATKTAGYKALATYLDVDPVKIKKALSWVGQVSDDVGNDKGRKTVMDFFDCSFNIKEILKTDFPPVNWCVHDLIPEGFGLLAGRPKAMKSWTMLKLVYSVQNGWKFLERQCNQGDALYLALEDNRRRMKDRILKLNFNKAGIIHPTINNEAPYLNQGLEESIKLWYDQVNNPRLVVIDTLAKVKKVWSRKGVTAYDADSDYLKNIQKLAMELNITIMVVSHLGKSNFEYDWDRIQGSTGMQGISDFFLMLDRGDNSETAFIKGRGRDMEDFEFGLKWNENTWSYDFEGELQHVLMSQNKKDILEAMKSIYSAKQSVKPKDVADFLAVSPQNKKERGRIQKTMTRMRESLELDYGEGQGEYTLGKADRPKEVIDFEKDKVN